MTTTPTSGAADLLDLIEAYAEARHIHGHSSYNAKTATALQAVKAALAAGQATAAPAQPAPENIRVILARCRDFIDTTKVPAYPAGADLADEIDLLLAAQPAEASRFGSPELQAMIIARCVEKDRADSVPAVSDLPPLPAPDLRDVGTKPQEIKEFLKGYATEYARTAIAARAPADSVQEDAALWHWLAEYLVGPRTDLDDEIVASETVNDLRKLVEAAIKQGEKK